MAVRHDELDRWWNDLQADYAANAHAVVGETGMRHVGGLIAEARRLRRLQAWTETALKQETEQRMRWQAEAERLRRAEA